ncbi:glycosyltransferase family 2 protein [Metabacillus arenae]|uniref:Glycosyltransferase n=1 Tax=Metabacillus arenae TaxID=2771434 RepID=A0A926NFD3_9BACI|nr:glycosyltransferase [Metabacillus arenae]MBD1378983.1 glycosyltransferase [Metabacillus arenae]
MHEKKTTVSIIFPAKNEGQNVKTTLDSLFTARSKTPFDVIVVDDGSTDGCCDFLSDYMMKDKVTLIRTKGVGPSKARNLGAENSAADYLIFCDAHLLFEDLWIERLMEPLVSGKANAVTPGIAPIEDPTNVGYGMTLSPSLKVVWNRKKHTIFETAILPGGCCIIPKKIFNDVGGFETGFATWGHEDVEISIKLWLFGYRCVVQPSVKILHLFRKAHPYQVNQEDIDYNFIRMAYLHFGYERIQKTRTLLAHRHADKIERRVLQDGAQFKRTAYFKKRKFSDDWFFKKFKISF